MATVMDQDMIELITDTINSAMERSQGLIESSQMKKEECSKPFKVDRIIIFKDNEKE